MISAAQRHGCQTVPQRESMPAPVANRLARDPDVVVVGAGPAGCVTALACARKGASVLLLEAQPDGKRLAGEWLHPPGVEVLRKLGVPAIPAASDHLSGRGFVVFPDNGSEPIVLTYPAGQLGMTCEHHALVTALRATATSHPGIRYLSGARVAGLEKQRVDIADGSANEMSVQAGLIVGADGRSSLVRRHLGIPDQAHADLAHGRGAAGRCRAAV